MIAKWYNTNAVLAAGMVGIRANPLGKVKKRGKIEENGEKEGEALEGSLEDPAIFGRLEDQELWMGHIELPQPVANIQYLRGTSPVLPARLGMERKEIERILYGGVFVAAEDTSEFSFGQVIPQEDAAALKHKDRLLYGAAALRMLLEKKGVPTHFVKELSDRETAVKKVTIVPLEVIIRNRAAGSICKRLGLEEGMDFVCPSIEFSYKDDDLGDPLINDDHALALGAATEEELAIKPGNISPEDIIISLKQGN